MIRRYKSPPKKRAKPRTGRIRLPWEAQGAIRSKEHLDFVRSQKCCVAGCSARGLSEAHHIRTAATAGTSKKPGDDKTVPLCRDHHRELHRNGARTFEEKYRVDLTAIALRLAAASQFLQRKEI